MVLGSTFMSLSPNSVEYRTRPCICDSDGGSVKNVGDKGEELLRLAVA
jgi:hypothetical protein